MRYGLLASAIHALTEEVGTEEKLAMPAGLAMQQPKPNKTADASEQSELTISDVFCHPIKLKIGGKKFQMKLLIW